MKVLVKIGLILALPLFWGCATTPQPNVNFSSDYWDNKETKIGVYVGELPAVKGHLSGAACLLCLAAASAINADLADHMKSQSNEDLADLKDLLIATVEEKGVTVVPIEGPIDFRKLPKNSAKIPNATRYNFSSIGKQNDVKKVLVLDFGLLGTMRNFANYVPVGDPYAMFNAMMYVVNTETNTYEFYEPINVTKYSETPWKEEGYPGITNAYYTVLELGKSRVLDLETFAPTAPVAAAADDANQESDAAE